MTKARIPSGIFNGAPIQMPAGLVQSRTRPFFARAQGRQFEARVAAAGVTEIDLYDEIGFWGVTAQAFRAQLRGAGDVRLRINSPGGDVFDGIAIHNDLVAHQGRVDVEISGLAASAASIVAMAGDSIAIAHNAFLMIHNAWTIAVGDRHNMRGTADVLEKIDGALADTYAARSGKDRAALAALMDEETWFSGQEAVDEGFADAVSETAAPQAAFDLSGFRHAPQGLSLPAAAKPTTIRDLERVLTQDAGMSRSQARALLRKGFPAHATQDAGADADFVAAFRPLLETVTKGVAP